MSAERRLCDLCDARPAKHYLDLQGIKLAVCSGCAVEARRDGIDLDLALPAVDREGEGKR